MDDMKIAPAKFASSYWYNNYHCLLFDWMKKDQEDPVHSSSSMASYPVLRILKKYYDI